MRTRLGAVLTAFWLAGFVGVIPCSAQLDENLNGLTDENTQFYLAPLNAALSGTLNSAVFRSGYVPSSGFTFTGGVAVMAIGFAEDDRTYVPADPTGFTSLEPTEVPTVIGDAGGVIVAGEGGLQQGYPGGFDLDGFELATPQVAIGAIAGTRLLVRYFAIDLGDSDFGQLSYLGIGAQHSISQWMANFPVDLAGGIFIHKFNIGDDLIKATGYHLNVTASKQFKLLQPYVGLGYDSIQTDVKYESEDDPDLSVDTSLEQEGDFHLTLGILARIPVVSAFFEFNAAAGTGFALGLDFGK